MLTQEGQADPTWLQVIPLGQWLGARGAAGPPLGAAAGAQTLPDRNLPGTGD